VARPAAAGLLAAFLILTAGCASRRAAANFTPASEAQAREALDAWSAIRRRADALPAARLLYDAKMSNRGAPAVPGTLAVTYDGSDVTRASLTGPFGKPVAEYANGAITGGGRQPFPIDPRILKSVLAAEWPGDPASVAGCEAAVCLLEFPGPIRADAVVDRREARVVSLRITGDAGAISVSYEGAAPAPWPERVAVEEERKSSRLALHLVASEPGAAAPSGGSAR
jgi:hypothetical protein